MGLSLIPIRSRSPQDRQFRTRITAFGPASLGNAPTQQTSRSSQSSNRFEGEHHGRTYTRRSRSRAPDVAQASALRPRPPAPPSTPSCSPLADGGLGCDAPIGSWADLMGALRTNASALGAIDPNLPIQYGDGVDHAERPRPLAASAERRSRALGRPTLRRSQ